MKIVTILGARPHFIKAVTVSEKIANNDLLSETIVHTGQHFDKNMSSIFFNEMGLPKPKYNLNINNHDYGKMVKSMFSGINEILSKKNFNGVLVYGDTNTTLAAALSAKKFNLPIFHVESGLRSYNRLMIEENNRIIVDHLSSLLFCPTMGAVENLKKENLKKGVKLSGDVMYDSYLKFSKIANYKLKVENPFILATIHRRENIFSPKKLTSIFENFERIHQKINILFPLHPHTKQIIDKYNIKSNVSFIEPVGYLGIIDLLNKCEMVITDSGGLQKEAYFAKKKCLTIRDQTEWVELVNKGVNFLCEPKNTFNEFNKLIEKKCDFSKNLYGNGLASNYIVNSIASFLS